jgi:o-succinylbenzoate synthase
LKAYWKKKVLTFKRPSGTSRGVLKTKATYFLILESKERVGIGECSTLEGLSIDHLPSYEHKLNEVVTKINAIEENTPETISVDSLLGKEKVLWPSIRFGIEMAWLDLENGGRRILYPSNFTQSKSGIPINGLIWMGEPAFMKDQIASLLKRGFKCLKMKIGAINFSEEISILKSLRKEFSSSDLILRVDANGAFPVNEALERLQILSDLELHSIEQPIMAGQVEEMAGLCEQTPLPIALDEELILVQELDEKIRLLEVIKPQYIILKPSLVGGFKSSEEWISAAKKLSVSWWATSALESNIGLSAISQWTYIQNVSGHQGLGTGSLYTNNIESPLEVVGEEITYQTDKSWDLHELER